MKIGVKIIVSVVLLNISNVRYMHITSQYVRFYNCLELLHGKKMMHAYLHVANAISFLLKFEMAVENDFGLKQSSSFLLSSPFFNINFYFLVMIPFTRLQLVLKPLHNKITNLEGKEEWPNFSYKLAVSFLIN